MSHRVLILLISLMLGLGACADASNKAGRPGVDANNDANNDFPNNDANNDVNNDPAPMDGDGDGYSDAVDCDDASAAIHPGADELCDGVDNDCDQRIDEGLPLRFPDADGDSFGDATAAGDCGLADGVADQTDCDDSNAAIHPGAAEICNEGTDDDCDGLADDLDDDTIEAPAWFRDGDGDTFGDPDTSTAACAQPEGFVSNDLDCNDLAVDIHPDAAEVCNDLDDDCDEDIDEDLPRFYTDDDDDTFGDVNDPGVCQPEGRVENNLDCDDANANIHPDAAEICNEGTDDDCDGLADDLDDDRRGGFQWFRDGDGDSFGDPDNTTTACAQPEGFVGVPNDCDDGDFAVNPDAAEVCNGGIDDNCDGDADEQDPGIALTTFYVDSDGDSYGVDGLSLEACEAPMGYAAQGGDCDDNNPLRSPGLEEILGDGIDNDCDGLQRPPVVCEGVQVPGDYASLTAAVAALNNSAQPRTICVGPGTFNGGFTLGANVQIVGAGAELTRVTGNVTAAISGTFRAMPESRLQHLHLTGDVTLNDTSIYRLTMADLVVVGNIFVDRDSGGTPHLTVERCDLSSPRAITEAIYVYDYSRFPTERMEIIVRDSWIHDSHLGFRIASGGTNTNMNHRVVNRVQLDNNTFQNNTYGIQFAGNLTNSVWSYHNNLFLQNDTAARIYYEGAITHDFNAFSGNATNFRDFAAPDANSPRGDLMIDAAARPPRPLPDSPLKGAGQGPRRSPTDFWGVPRATPPSIGAVE